MIIRTLLAFIGQQNYWKFQYSGNRPYGHIFFGCLAKTAIHFLVKTPSLIWPSINRANFFWPSGDHINWVPL